MANHFFTSLIVGLSLFMTIGLGAQAPDKWTSSDIRSAIEKLNFLGSALYVAAHPDDENTRLIAYLANELKAETAYCSMTRGDGGQNLIGPEIRELLGLIRTHELLGARSVDGGSQFVTRANDFGYSKHPDETFNIWDKDQVMADLIWNIRKWQPDVVINRFDHRSPGSTHGHHTASAMLSVEAFDLAGDPQVHREQLKDLDVWQPRRLFFNTSWWFYGSRENFAKADKSRLLSVDVGVYYPLIGKSNTEIAAESRSMHKCQGFGSAGSRGEQSEYLELLKGDMPSGADIFEGINTTWSRVEGGKPIGEILARVEKNYDYQNPSASVPELLKARRMIAGLEDGYWKRVKLAEIERVIEASIGLYLEAIASVYHAVPGETVELAIEMINRSAIPVKMRSVTIKPAGQDTTLNLVLENNVANRIYRNLIIPAESAYTSPYWLDELGSLGMYTVEDQNLRGLPETPRPNRVVFMLTIAGEPMMLEKEIVYKRTDPVKAEVYRPFEIIPEASVRILNPVYIFPDDRPREVTVMVRSGIDSLSATVGLELPDGWRSEPEYQVVSIANKGAEEAFIFQVFPSRTKSEGELTPVVSTEGGTQYNREMIVIEYDHIPTQTVLRPAQARVAKLDIERRGSRIAYVMGAGDQIPTSLEQIGYQVDLLDVSDVSVDVLKGYDALIIGIRAYNTVDRIQFANDAMLEYVKQGGTMIVQYNTTRGLRLPSRELGPFPFALSRDRVAVEGAEVRFLAPDHPVLNFPNKITSEDFAGWVQERGLYFPNEWSPEYEPILSSNDPGEDAKDGGLLIAKYGEGHYIYTGYSWFRELPAGVSGAYRLFANMISIGQAP
ncbi:MAG: PIG-L family deacetylase [Saprospiraceae bacterium]|nr:PIG-L family deacetylase [Saprospiraceae bacterium]